MASKIREQKFNKSYRLVGRTNKNDTQQKQQQEQKLSGKTGKWIRSNSSESKSVDRFHQNVYIWNIPAFRRFADAQSGFTIVSPTFTCPTGRHQISEWNLLLNYSPEDSGSVRVGIALQDLKGDGSNEIRAHVTLSAVKSKGGVAMICGTIKRNFKVRERRVFINRHVGNETEERRCEENSHSECHEWSDPISMIRICEGPHAALEENILRLRADVKVWEWPERVLDDEAIQALTSTSHNSEKLPNPTTYWDIKQNPDCVILCDDGIFKVHQEDLAGASPVFAAMIADFKITNAKEVSTTGNFDGTVTLRINAEARIIAILLECIYSGSLGTFEYSHMNFDIAKKLLEAAHVYNISIAKDLLFQKVISSLDWHNAGYYATYVHDFKASPSVKTMMNKYLRKNWGILQQSEEFRHLYKTKPEAFEFVFSSRITPTNF